jgi:hypothetical protein
LVNLKEHPELIIFFACDGPRNLKDHRLIEECWSAINEIFGDIPNSRILKRDHNLGCKIAMKENIDWFFKNVNQGVILEDDCLPAKNFFKIMAQALDKFSDSPEYISISATDVNFSSSRSDFTFRPSAFPMVWGWATWAHKWNLYSLEIPDRIEITKYASQEIYSDKKFIKRIIFESVMKFRFYEVEKNRINTWDYSLTASAWRNKLKTLQINGNLIINNGFTDDATHTKGSMPSWVPTVWEKPNENGIVQQYDHLLDEWMIKNVYHCTLSEVCKNLIKWVAIKCSI